MKPTTSLWLVGAVCVCVGFEMFRGSAPVRRHYIEKVFVQPLELHFGTLFLFRFWLENGVFFFLWKQSVVRPQEKIRFAQNNNNNNNPLCQGFRVNLMFLRKTDWCC